MILQTELSLSDGLVEKTKILSSTVRNKCQGLTDLSEVLVKGVIFQMFSPQELTGEGMGQDPSFCKASVTVMFQVGVHAFMLLQRRPC